MRVGFVRLFEGKQCETEVMECSIRPVKGDLFYFPSDNTGEVITTEVKLVALFPHRRDKQIMEELEIVAYCV